MKKEKIQAYIDKDTKHKLEAGRDGRSLSNHAGNILKKHVEKKEQVKHTPKKEL
jgi:hypothetical protein